VERRYLRYENDISAEETAKIKGSRLQGQNENCCWQESIGCQKIKRKKEIISLRIINL